MPRLGDFLARNIRSGESIIVNSPAFPSQRVADPRAGVYIYSGSTHLVWVDPTAAARLEVPVRVAYTNLRGASVAPVSARAQPASQR